MQIGTATRKPTAYQTLTQNWVDQNSARLESCMLLEYHYPKPQALFALIAWLLNSIMARRLMPIDWTTAAQSNQFPSKQLFGFRHGSWASADDCPSSLPRYLKNRPPSGVELPTVVTARKTKPNRRVALARHRPVPLQHPIRECC